MRSFEETRVLIKMAKEMGVRVLKLDGFEVVLDPQEVSFDPASLSDPNLKPFTEDEIRFMAVGGSGLTNKDGSPVEMPGVDDGN